MFITILSCKVSMSFNVDYHSQNYLRSNSKLDYSEVARGKKVRVCMPTSKILKCPKITPEILTVHYFLLHLLCDDFEHSPGPCFPVMTPFEVPKIEALSGIIYWSNSLCIRESIYGTFNKSKGERIE